MARKKYRGKPEILTLDIGETRRAKRIYFIDDKIMEAQMCLTVLFALKILA